MVFPATLTSGLGLDQVWGRMRVAQPAVGMTIFKVSDKVVSGMGFIVFYLVAKSHVFLGMSPDGMRSVGLFQFLDFILVQLDIQGSCGLVEVLQLGRSDDWGGDVHLIG